MPSRADVMRTTTLSEDESRAIVRRVLGISGELTISREINPSRRLRMLSILNVSNDCLHRHRTERGPNAHATYTAMCELARTLGAMPGAQRDAVTLQEKANRWLAGFFERMAA